MNSRVTVATAPKTSTFQIRMNPEIRKKKEMMVDLVMNFLA